MCCLDLNVAWFTLKRSLVIVDVPCYCLCCTIGALCCECQLRVHHVTRLQPQKDVLPSHHQSYLIYEFECRNCVIWYVGRAAKRLSSRIRQHVPLHLLPEDSGAHADRLTRGRPRKSPETEDLAPQVAIIAEETLSEANETDSAAQGPAPLTAVASGMSLATADGANPTVVEDALSGLVDGTAGRADVEQSTLRPSLPRACKKSWTPQVQLKGKPRPPSEHKRWKQLLWCLRVEHGWLKFSQPELLFHERVRWPQTQSQKTRRRKCYQKRSHHMRNQRRSLLTTSPRWPGTLPKTKVVHWLTVTIRFVSSVFARWLQTLRSWRLFSTEPLRAEVLDCTHLQLSRHR